MRYVVTLNNVSRTDFEKLGFRASDLGVLKEKGFNIPLSFVINSEAFEEFMAENGLRIKIDRALLEKDPDTEIQALFSKAKMSRELEEELVEAYESLTIEAGTPANNMIAEFNFPFIMMVRSPSYLLETEDEEGIFQNIKGKESYMVALKMVWASYFSSKSMAYRRKHGISENFSAAILVEKMKKTKASAITYSRADFDEFAVIVKTLKGLPDFGTPLIGKDYYEVDNNTLLIKKSQVNVQEFEITRDIDTGQLVKRPLLQDASRQKVNDKIISELARITKRSKSFIGKDLKISFGIMDEYIYILQVTRMAFHPKTQIEETDEIDMIVNQEGKTMLTHEHDVIEKQTDARDNKFVLPGILSSDEAKHEALKASPEKVFSLTGFEKGTIEVKQEEELLDRVMLIKETAERMQEHATSGNKEAYDHEIRKLRDLIGQ